MNMAFYCLNSGRRSSLSLEALPLFRHVRLLEILCVLITQLEVDILNSLLDPLLATQTDDGAHALFDGPC